MAASLLATSTLSSSALGSHEDGVADFISRSTPGYSFCFGVLSDYYSRTDPFKDSSAIANIGTCCSGIMYLGGFPALVLNRMFPRWARYSPLVGLFILCAALCVSAWATNVTVLIITQGIFYGIGGAIAYTPCTMYIDVSRSTHIQRWLGLPPLMARVEVALG